MSGFKKGDKVIVSKTAHIVGYGVEIYNSKEIVKKITSKIIKTNKGKYPIGHKWIKKEETK